MKKIIVFIVGLILTMCSFSVVSASYESKKYSDYDGMTGLLEKLDVYTDSNYTSGDTAVTRGDFVRYAAALYNGAYSEVYKNEYWDIDKSDETAKSIAILSNMGYISGYPDGSFSANRNITFAEALKILNSILGYGDYALLRGEYPMGDFYTANDNGLISVGVDYNADELNYDTLVQLLYNALTVRLFKINSTGGSKLDYSNQGQETLLSRYFGIYETEGVAEATGVGNIRYGYDSAPAGIEINGEKYTTDSIYDKYLGYTVKCFYEKLDGGSDRKAVYLFPTRKNEETVLTADDIISFDKGSLSYSDTQLRQRTKKIPDESYIIYNGRSINYSTDYGKELFEFEDGRAVLLDNSGDGMIDVVFIYSYKNIVVQAVNADEEKIYDKYDSTKTVDLGNKQVTYSIKDVNENDVLLTSISEWDILSVAESIDKKNIDIIVSTERIEGIAKSFSSGADYGTVTIGEKDYQILNSAIENADINITAGKKYVFYINVSERIAAVEETREADINCGYLVNMVNINGLYENAAVSFFNRRGERVILNLTKNVKIDGESGYSVLDIEKKFAPSDGKTYACIPFIYKVNAKNEITEIDTPDYNIGKEKKDSLKKRFSGSRFYKNNGTFYGMYAVPADTFVVAIPAVDGTDSDINISKVRIMTGSDMGNDAKYDVDLYSLDDDNPILKIVVLKNGTFSNEISNTTPLSIVTKIFDSVNADDEAVRCLELYTSNSYSTVAVSKDVSDKLEGIDKGDIIRYGTDGDGLVNDIEWCYDYSEGMPKNALDIEESGKIPYFNNEFRVILGRIYSVTDNYVSVVPGTTVEKIFNDDGSVNYENAEVHKITSGTYYEVTSKGKVVMDKITAKDLVDYRTGGGDASTIIVQTSYGYFKDALLIK